LASVISKLLEYLGMISSFVEASGGTTWFIDGPMMDVPVEPIWTTIERTLRAGPDAICVKCGPYTLTRRDLLDTVNRFDLLRGFRNIGIHVSRSIGSVAATLAAWLRGATYVPLPLEHPPSRTAAILESCDVDFIVSDAARPFDGYVLVNQEVLFDRPLYFHSRAKPASAGTPDDRSEVCYVAHTSGTTGGPKSVKIPHVALLNRVLGMMHVLGASDRDVFLYKTSSIFDVHVWELVLPLVAGGIMVIHPQMPHFDLFEAARQITAERVTFVGFVPGLLGHLLSVDTFVHQNSLRTVLCGGEAWGPRLAEKFHSALPGRSLFNSYGPAETTISVANCPVPAGQALPLIPLGYPMPNVFFLIEEHERVTEDRGAVVTGMLSIGGVQVGLGYVDNRLTESFFTRDIAGKHIRFYRTGDLVTLDTNTGLTTFVGREDTQVKINGVRIELQEVENAIAGIDGIERCVAVVVTSGPAPLLCAAFKSSDDVPVDIDVIRQACRARLPAALVPSRLRQILSFPHLSSGKVDRTSLVRQFMTPS
jgi:amino acid adenylation domain-containing protein